MRFIERIKAAVHRGPAKWESIKQVPASVDKHTGQSASMERHPYSFTGVDREGNPKSVETVMRDSTVPAVVRGFWVSGYLQLEVTRKGTEPVGGIDKAEGLNGAMPWHKPIRDQRQPS